MQQTQIGAFNPVFSLQQFIEVTLSAPLDSLFVWCDFMKLCSRTDIALMLWRLFEEADPGKLPWAHEIRKYSSTLAFLWTRSLERGNLHLYFANVICHPIYETLRA